MSHPPISKHSSPQPLSKLVWGIILVLLSAVFLAAQNVISRLFFVPTLLLGHFPLGGWLASQFSNITMLLALRMGLMAVLLAIAVPYVHADTFRDIQKLVKDVRLLGCVVSSGVCLFVGLIALYFALSQVVAGVAIALFFIYPAITLLLAWQFLKQRPQAYQLSVMPVIFLGIILTTQVQAISESTNAAVSSNPALGMLSALLAGLSFGIYGIFAEITLQPSKSQPKSQSKSQCHRQPRQSLHPVPFSLITFVIVSTLGGISLLFMPPVVVAAAAWQPILLMTIFSALITVTAYVLNNSGIRLIGASLTALISASAPALTALFAWIFLQERLQLWQMMGIALVTVGVAALSIKAKQQH